MECITTDEINKIFEPMMSKHLWGEEPITKDILRLMDTLVKLKCDSSKSTYEGYADDLWNEQVPLKKGHIRVNLFGTRGQMNLQGRGIRRSPGSNK